MALSSEQHETLARRTPAEVRDLRRRLERFMTARGLSDRDVSALCGYSKAAVGIFRGGYYVRVAANAAALCAALEEMLSQYDEAELLDDDPTGTLYTHTRNYKLLRKYFYLALENGWAFYVHGNPGTQKSHVVQALAAEVRAAEASKNGHARRVLYIEPLPEQSPLETLKQIAAAAGIYPASTKAQLLLKIRSALAGRRALIVFDEAQNLTPVSLGTIKPLLDHKPYIGMLFLGTHNLAQIFEHPTLEHWRSRMHAGESLPGLDVEEAEVIVRAEMPWLGAAERKQLIATCTSTDLGAMLQAGYDRRRRALRRDELPSYISARKLFWTILEAQRAHARKSGSLGKSA